MYKRTRDPGSIPDNTHTIATRANSKLNFKLPFPTSNKYSKSHIYQGQVMWNNLTHEDQLIPDISWFKRRIK